MKGARAIKNVNVDIREQMLKKKSVLKLSLKILVLLLLCSSHCFATEKGSWKALIIGIGEYQYETVPDLRTPVADGRDLAKVLSEQYGFKVETLFDLDATWKNIDNALYKLVEESKPQDSILIYYGGHGDLDEKMDEGWWYPSDAVPNDRQTYVKNSKLRMIIDRIKAKHVLLVSDSCFAGALFGDYRAFTNQISEDDKYHQRLYNSKSRLGLTSGGNEPVLDGGSDEHSIFAYHLLQYLNDTEKDVFSVGELFTEIAPIITNNSEQKPEFLPILNTGHEKGEFVFVREGKDIIHYVSSMPKSIVSTSSSFQPKDNRLIFIAAGLLVVFLIASFLVIPKLLHRRKENASQITPTDEKSVASVEVLTSPVAALVLENGKKHITIAPGPRQGIGRGANWPLAIADPHISRKPHAWLLMGDESISINSDGGEVFVNEEAQITVALKQGDIIRLGTLSEMLVEKMLPGLGAVFFIQAGPDKGKHLVLLGESVPFNWLVSKGQPSGKLSWREQRPFVSVGKEEQHPLSYKKESSTFQIAEGDILRIGEQDWTTKLL